jgi:hypothetical protein
MMPRHKGAAHNALTNRCNPTWFHATSAFFMLRARAGSRYEACLVIRRNAALLPAYSFLLGQAAPLDYVALAAGISPKTSTSERSR